MNTIEIYNEYFSLDSGYLFVYFIHGGSSSLVSPIIIIMSFREKKPALLSYLGLLYLLSPGNWNLFTSNNSRIVQKIFLKSGQSK